MKERTLAEHARAFWLERGTHMPLLGIRQGDEAYELWATWAFSNLDGRAPEAEAKAMKDIEAWEAGEFGPIGGGCTLPKGKVS